MRNFLSLLLFLVWSCQASAQDERFFRQLFTGDLEQITGQEKKKYSFVIHSPYYALDLNNDSKDENIVFVKKDSEDWIEIFNSDKQKIYSFLFEAKGFDSELFKIEKTRLSPSVTVLLLYYYEGVSKYIEFQGTSRVYVLTIENNDLQTISTFQGPSFFDESKNFRGHYHKRHYQVYLEDLNNDQQKELVVKHQRMSRVFLYQGKGKWTTFKNQF